ncbi:ABC transporter permease [Fulvivirga lutimaris]|uniref:ABC transporter permease n=1 Tax=Fulvivirga lutimaris TaxID=1819566 RepID=UPI0012BD5EF7|nr:ABC transporter permease [Fulvivirga lutimaris]MTI39388.1 ABC transporter permease [Fulvivirga lutimaris]
MLLNYIKIIFRNLLKSPLYFILNLFGLAVAIASCVVLMQYAVFESEYDKYQSDIENKYRVLIKDDGGTGAHTPAPLQSMIASDFSQVENAVSIREADGVLKYENDPFVSAIEHNMVSATPEFFEIFDIELLSGSKNGFADKGKVYITESIAEKYFGSIDALNKPLILFESNFGRLDLIVAGVMKDPRPDTHFPVNVLFSMETINNSENPWAKFDNMGWSEFYTYVKLIDGGSISQEESNTFLDKYIGKENRERAGLEVQFQPMSEIHSTPGIMYEYSPSRDKRILNFLMAIAIFIMFLACINFVNLATAKGLKRAKEVGIRKNMGASRGNLVLQFTIESLMINMLAVLLAITIIQLAKPSLSEGLGGAFDVSFWQNKTIITYTIIPIVVAMVWAALQPALIISSFSMVKILKGNVADYGKGKVYRKLSVAIQFAVSLVLMISSYIVYKQIELFQNQDLGIDINQKLIVNRPLEDVTNYNNKAITFREELKSLAPVAHVTASGSVPASGFNWSTNNMRRANREGERVGEYGINVTYIDNSYVDVFKPKLLKGVARVNETSTELKAIINKKALIPLEISSIDEAVGTRLINGDMKVEVVGVIDDYQHSSLRTESRPAIFLFQTNPQYITIDYNTGADPKGVTKQLLEDVENKYKAQFPGTNFTYTFLDQKFAEQYRYEVFFSKVIVAFAGLAILLSILGLFGLSLFNLERKTKEVGIRKTLGATFMQLFVTNVRPFANIFLISMLLAVPLAYYLAGYWLEDFTYKIELDALLFLVPVIGLMLIMLLTVSYHIILLGRKNPVDSLRYE